MYRQDVTQALTPSTASPEGAMRTSQLKAQSVGTIFAGAAELHTQKVNMDIMETEEEARKQRQAFFTSNQLAEAAAVDSAINSARARSLEEENKTLWDTMGQDTIGDPITGAAINERARVNLAAIDKFKAEAARLKQASEGGMSNEEYTTRVAAITKATIAKYPGMADRIRQEVGKITGLAGADEFAAYQFVRDRFDTSKKDDDKGPLTKNDLKELALSNKTTEAEILKSYGTPQFDAYVKHHQQRLALLQEKELLETDIKSQTFAHDSQAKEYAYPAIQKMGAIAGATALVDYRASDAFKGYLEAVKNAKSPEERLMLEQQQAEVIKTLLRQHKTTANDMISRLITQGKGKLSADTIKELRAEVDYQFANIESTHLDANGTTAMLSVLTKYKDKNFQQLMQLHSVNVGLLNALSNNDLVKQYLLGGKSAEYVRLNYPEVYKTIDGLMSNVERSGGSLGALVAAGNTTGLWGTAVRDAGMSPDATPPTVRTQDTDNVVAAQAYDSIAKWEQGEPVTKESINTVGTMLSNSVNGATFKSITQHWGRIEKFMQAVPPDQRGPLMESVNTYYQQAVAQKRTEYLQWAQSNNVVLNVIPKTASIYVANGTKDQKNYVQNHVAPYIYAASRARALASGESLDVAVKETLKLYTSKSAVGGFVTQPNSGLDEIEKAVKSGKLPDGQTFASTPEEKDIVKILTDEMNIVKSALQVVQTSDGKRRLESDLAALEAELQRQKGK